MYKSLKNFATPSIISLLVFSMLFIQCKKGKTDTERPSVEAQKIIKFKELAKEVLALAKNPTFKKVVYDECKSQKFGDYYVRVEDLFKKSTNTISVSSDKVAVVMKIVSDLKALGARSPIIFYPSVETKEDRKNSINARTTDEEEVVSVIDESGGVGYINDQYPGYRFNTDGQLEYYQQITEEFAWDHDVWVIGQEEGDPSNDTTLINYVNGRFNGQAEYGGIIQVTDFSSIEPWINGKPEFEYRVYSASGTLIKHREFPKVKRRDVKAPSWKDFGDFITFWNTSVVGNWTIEGWTEQDDRGGRGNTTTISQAFPAACTGCPTTNVNYTIKSTDYDMGRTIIQFTDPISQVYNISHANIKRKN